MRSINLNIYNIKELKEEFPEAYKTAYDKWYCGAMFPFDNEYENIRKNLEAIFGIYITEWNMDFKTARYNCILEDEELDFAGTKLYGRLMNRYFHHLFHGKYYGKNGVHRHSNVIFEHCCVLTGYWADEEVLKPIYDFLEKPDSLTTFRLLVQYVVDAWINTYRKDSDDYFTEESFEGQCEANEWEFFDDGRMI